MPLAMLCFRSKSISVIVVSITNFTLKLAYLTEKKILIYMHLLSVVIYWLTSTRTSRKKKIDSSMQDQEFSVYNMIISIITEKKRLVYLHMAKVIYINLLYGRVLWLTRPLRFCQENLDLGYYFLTHGE